MARLLLIEDNPADARLVEEYLSETSPADDAGSVRWEERLRSGLDRLRDDGADCILLDLGLPDSNGLGSVERVARASGDTPVIVLTGLDDEETAVRAVQAGADDYLRKEELTPTSLRRAVRYARERRRLEEAARAEARRLDRILSTVSEGVLVTDESRGVAFANPAAERMLGIPSGDSRQLDLDDPESEIRVRGEAGLPDGELLLENVLRSGRTIEDVALEVRRPDGEELVLSMNASRLPAAVDGAGGVVISLRDVTERKQFEEQLRHRALHDPLTGLPNRVLFRDRLQNVLESARRTGESVAVFFLDIDRFKVINDSLGHEAGDRLLEEVAERLRSSVRGADTVARMGGDEFVVLLEDLEDRAAAESVAERIAESLQAPVDIGEHQVHVEASVGIVVRERGSGDDVLADSDAFVGRADEAMYRAKESPGTAYRFAGRGEESGGTSQLKLETRLRDALDRGEVETAYQPIFDLESGAVTGLEALSRWSDPELGEIPPARFVPLAEETGLIAELGRQQLRGSCERLAGWTSSGAVDPGLRLHVNLSMRQLDDPGFVGDLRAILDDTGLPPERLWLEITESVTMRQPDRLMDLRRLGVRLTVDDFGTRHSTLAQLKRLDLDALKVDRSFVAGLGEDRRDRAIVASVVTLGQSLGLEVIAEGIETEGQLAVLEEMGCDSGQGYLVGRPGARSHSPSSPASATGSTTTPPHCGRRCGGSSERAGGPPLQWAGAAPESGEASGRVRFSP